MAAEGPVCTRVLATDSAERCTRRRALSIAHANGNDQRHDERQRAGHANGRICAPKRSHPSLLSNRRRWELQDQRDRPDRRRRFGLPRVCLGSAPPSPSWASGLSKKMPGTSTLSRLVARPSTGRFIQVSQHRAGIGLACLRSTFRVELNLCIAPELIRLALRPFGFSQS